MKLQTKIIDTTELVDGINVEGKVYLAYTEEVDKYGRITTNTYEELFVPNYDKLDSKFNPKEHKSMMEKTLIQKRENFEKVEFELKKQIDKLNEAIELNREVIEYIKKIKV